MTKYRSIREVSQAQQSALMKAGLERTATRKAQDRANNPYPPKGWKRPAYGTSEFAQAVYLGWITEDEVQAAYHRSERAKRNLPGSGPIPPRWKNNEPRDSRQYAGYVATTAMRDDRLTPQAKALLMVLRARIGNGRVTKTTKETLAAALSRSKRSIQRYLRELVQFDYIRADIRRDDRGWHTGLIIRLCEKVFPFWKDDTGLANWLAEVGDNLPNPFDYTDVEHRLDNPKLFNFTGETDMSSKNYNPNLNYTIGQWAPLLATLSINRKRLYT